MFSVELPWLLLLIPLPLLMRFVRPKKREQAALRAPFFDRVKTLPDSKHTQRTQHTARTAALWLIWGCAVLAAANPQWVGEPKSLPTSGRDLLLAVDISGSMEQTDMQVQGKRITRLMAVKHVIGDFVVRRKADRLGLILFGAQAYLQAPLTYDRETVNTLLQEAQIGFAGRETAIGDAIGLAVKRLRDRPNQSRVLVLLTDGSNTAGELDPLKAADLAKQSDIKIYTIAFGADEMEVQGIFGKRRVNPSQDLDEPTMMSIAEHTGGKYFRARDLDELAQVHYQLDLLEPVIQESETFRPVQSLFYWPLGLAFILSLLMALMPFASGSLSAFTRAGGNR